MSASAEPARPARAPGAHLVFASNRGPVALVRQPDGTVEERRGVGGLVTAVGGAVRGRRAVWVAAAITEDDRARAATTGAPVRVDLGNDAAVDVRFALLDDRRYDLYYNELSNRILWFLHHSLWDTPRAPSFGVEDGETWDAYVAVNRTFAEHIAAVAGRSTHAFPQDYHLSLVPSELRRLRPSLPIAHFWHIPFCAPDQFRILPDAWGRALLEGLLAADLVGFHTERWAANFLACCREVLGARVRGHVATHQGRTTKVGVFPIGVDAAHLAAQADRPEVARAARALDERVGERTLILRVDRTELSKNILRGLIAYETMLASRHDLHRRVVHLALLTPSRRGVPEYQEYVRECRKRARRINERFGGGDWTPVLLEIADDFPRTLAAYRRFDVLVVNPTYDGMNLVAREGPVLNRRGGVLVLSRNAGAAAELAPAALLVNPFDPVATARAIATAVDMAPDERRERAHVLSRLARGTPPERWLDLQLRVLERIGTQNR